MLNAQHSPPLLSGLYSVYHQLIQIPFRHMMHLIFIAPVFDVSVFHIFDNYLFPRFTEGDDVQDLEVLGELEEFGE